MHGLKRELYGITDYGKATYGPGCLKAAYLACFAGVAWGIGWIMGTLWPTDEEPKV